MTLAFGICQMYVQAICMPVARYIPKLYGTHGCTGGAHLIGDEGTCHRLGGVVQAALLLKIVLKVFCLVLFLFILTAILYINALLMQLVSCRVN